MAGRCSCSSSTATGASLTAGSCATVTGAGTTASPAVIGVKLDPAASNLLQCGPDGLYAATAQVEAADESISVTGDGSSATPYEVGVQIAPQTHPDFYGVNVLRLYADPNGGLGVDSWRDADGSLAINAGLLDTDGALAGPGISDPSQAFILFQGGTQIVSLDASGNGNVTFPTPYPNSLISFVPVDGDSDTSAFSISLGAPALGSHGVHCEPINPADPVASTNVRITYIAMGI